MKKGLKRVVALLCAVAMIAGGCFVSNGWVTKASDDVTTEWSVVSEVGDITNKTDWDIYYSKTGLNIQLNKEKTRDCYMLYIKVNLRGATAVNSMADAYVELANTGDADGELCWTPAYWETYGIELQTGVNELYLPLDKFTPVTGAGNEAFSMEKAITYFRIYKSNVLDCTGVILDEVKIIDVSPVVQEYPNGATATVEPTENVPNGYEFAGWYTDKACDNVLSGTTKSAAYAKFVKEEVLSVKTQYTTHKGPGVIDNCDTVSGKYVTNGIATKLTTTAGEYKEGKGAFYNQTKSNVMMYFTLSNPVDISDYADGYLHLSIYVDNPNNIKTGLLVDLGHDGTANFYNWEISPTNLSVGWNELYLDIAAPKKLNGTVELKNIDYFRIRQYSGATENVLVRVDDIRAVEKMPDTIIDNCDTVSGKYVENGIATKLTTTAGEYKEGKGAFYNQTKSNVMMYFTLSNPVDISDYADGYLHLSIYVDNPNNIKTGLLVDLGHDGTANFYNWEISPTNLSVGWNELYLDIAAPKKLNGTVELKNIDYFRIRQYSGATENVLVRVDDIRAVKKMPDRAIIDNCDTVSGKYVTNGIATKLTTTAGEYKEGTGAFYNQTKSNVMMYFTLSNPVDISNYSDGYLHLSVYVDNPNNIKTGLIVDFGNDDSTFYNWIISSTSLSVGWNELYLDIASKITGNVDLKSIDYLRIRQYSGATEAVLVRIDDVYVEEDTSKEIPEDYADLRFVTTVDSLNYANVGFKIGIGANSMEVSSKEVYGTLYGVSNANKTLKYTPDVFTIESSYFKTHTLTNIPDTAFDTEITVTPFWTTQDGTKVYGTAKTCTVNGEIAADATEEEETDLRVVFSSDIHYTALVDCYSTDKDARMKHWVDCIIAENEKDPIDLLVINGDVSLDYLSTDSFSGLIEGIVDSESDMTEAFIGTYLTQVKKAGIDVWVMPGNHESYTDDDWKDLTGNARQGSMVVDNNLFIFLDNYNSSLGTDTSSDSTYTATSTQQVTDAMDANPDLDVYLIAHYFDTAEDDTKDSSGADIDTNLQTLLTGTYGDRIKGLFAGHSHEANIRQLDSTWGSKVIAQTGNFSYYFEAANNKPFWGFRELIITEDSAYSQYISVDGITGDENTSSYTRKTTDSVWYY